MINLIAILCSLCIQFCAVQYPVDITALNSANINVVQTAVNSINDNYNYNIDYHRVIMVNRNNSTYPFYVFVPKELVDSSVTSTIVCNSRNDSYVSTTSSQWLRFQIQANGLVFTGTTPAVNNVGNLYFSGNNGALLYNGYYTLPLNGVDSFIVENPSSPPVIEGHSSGFSDLIETVDGVSYTVLGHSDNGINNSNSFDLVTISSGLTDKLLAAIGRLLAGINDSLSYGQGTLIGVGSLILTHILDIKNWLFEPVDTTLLQYRWGHSSLGTLVDTINIDFNGHAYNPDDLVFRWNLSQIPYFENCVGSFNLSSALDPTKYIWQPLLITLLYASLVWGFIRSIPNIIGGVSPISNNHIQAPKDTPKTSKGG